MADFTAPIKPLNQTTRIEPATLADLERLTDLLVELFEIEADFSPDRMNQEKGLRLILEQPSRGRIFVVRTDYEIIGMVNCLFTISTVVGGFSMMLEDVIINPEFRGQGYGSKLINYAAEYARKKDFKRLTLLTDKMSEDSQRFFEKIGFQHSQMIPMRLNLEV